MKVYLRMRVDDAGVSFATGDDPYVKRFYDGVDFDEATRVFENSKQPNGVVNLLNYMSKHGFDVTFSNVWSDDGRVSYWLAKEIFEEDEL